MTLPPCVGPTQCGLPESVGISVDKMKRFIIGVRDRMLDNPYHNWFHIFDVTQTTYCLALLCGIIDRLTHMQTFALIISALCHDLEHPGVNNVFVRIPHHPPPPISKGYPPPPSLSL